ncbi:hypothetical protein OAU61_04275 [Planktomarina temperata]|nr:hypothetical protein [Planktomarina temperata]
MVQSPFGNIADSLTSADSVDGQGGADSLHAVLTPQNEQVGDTQPTIVNVETITIEARDVVAAAFQGTVFFDGKDITGHDSIGSYYSDGDLVIENLNTLTDSGAIRLTSDITVTMAYTDNFNSDNDASDLTVYFDEDYLNTSVNTSGSTLLVHVVNVITNVVVGNPLSGTSTLSVNVGGTEVIVDVSAIAADATLTAATAYAATAEAINAAMTAAGFTTVTATAQTATPAVFSIGVTVDGTAYATGDSAGDYSPILLTNTGAEELTKGKFSQAETGVSESDINAFMTSTVASDAAVPISINIDLEKVGRDGDGGDLIVGGKDLGSQTNTDVDQNDGIEVFNINVIGDEDKPSNLGSITSTNEALRTVNIATDAGEDGTDGYAALTVRGTQADSTFGGTLDSLNANNFLGDLHIGQIIFADNIDNFTATGGGDVTLNMFEGSEAATLVGPHLGMLGEGVGSGLASSGALLRGVTTGAGDDTINLEIMGGAQAVVNTGGGDDTFTASINGNTNSSSTESSLDLTSASGDNTVRLDTEIVGEINAAEVDLGTGDDTVTGGSVALTVDTGAGDDVIYADNTGAKETVIETLVSTTVTLGANGTIAALNDSQLLYGQTMTITLAMPEADVDAISFINGYEITAAAVNTEGYISTATELHQSVADAINGDDTINHLVVATVDTTGTLTVTYLVDGAAAANTEVAMTVEFTGTALAAGTLTTDQSAFLDAVRAEVGNSALSDADIVTAINSAGSTISGTFEATGADSTAFGGDNTVNGGAGDDVIVLSSAATATSTVTDTLVMDALDFGNDVVVHFDIDDSAAASLDVLSFEFLDNMTSATNSTVSAVRIDGTVAAGTGVITENSVLTIDLGILTATTFETITEANLLTDLNGVGFDGTLAANTVGTTGKAIIMVEDDGNGAGGVNNAGYYNVYEVTYTDVAGAFVATDVNLAGSLDFGEVLTLADANII